MARPTSKLRPNATSRPQDRLSYWSVACSRRRAENRGLSIGRRRASRCAMTCKNKTVMEIAFRRKFHRKRNRRRRRAHPWSNRAHPSRLMVVFLYFFPFFLRGRGLGLPPPYAVEPWRARAIKRPAGPRQSISLFVARRRGTPCIFLPSRSFTQVASRAP